MRVTQGNSERSEESTLINPKAGVKKILRCAQNDKVLSIEYKGDPVLILSDK